MLDEKPPVTLTRVGGRGAGARARGAAVGVIAALTGLVALGALGGGESGDPRPVPSRAAAIASPDRSVAPPEAAPTAAPARSRVITPGTAGYEVAYPRDGSHRPVIFDDGSLAIFGYGERVPDGTYPGTIRVAVGMPAQGALVLGPGGQEFLHADTVGELWAAYRAVEAHVPSARLTYRVDGAPAMILAFDASGPGARARAVALIAHGGRSFVIVAAGFETLLPGVRNPAEAGLVRFLAGVRFTTPVFASRALGFQVPQPLDVPAQASDDGTVVFAAGQQLSDGQWSHPISVSVGTEDAPAVSQVLPGAGVPRVRRIWASSLVQLQEAYVDAVWGRVGSSTTIRLGDDLALLVQRPNGLSMTVLAVHRGRAYIVSASGIPQFSGPGTVPAVFDAFLEGFRFLDEE